ncbi:hypothetical protein [Dyella sp.]|uniref:hypothetical protein n=1 Tax=Dyella sp. TaxID=1869338 RepID=UPI002ECFE0D7
MQIQAEPLIGQTWRRSNDPPKKFISIEDAGASRPNKRMAMEAISMTYDLAAPGHEAVVQAVVVCRIECLLRASEAYRR